jgi:hypothetical protein
MEIGPQQIGKWLVIAGVIIVLLGVLMMALGRVGLFKLPGDLQFAADGGIDSVYYFDDKPH